MSFENHAMILKACMLGVLFRLARLPRPKPRTFGAAEPTAAASHKKETGVQIATASRLRSDQQHLAYAAGPACADLGARCPVAGAVLEAVVAPEPQFVIAVSAVDEAVAGDPSAEPGMALASTRLMIDYTSF